MIMCGFAQEIAMLFAFINYDTNEASKNHMFPKEIVHPACIKGSEPFSISVEPRSKVGCTAARLAHERAPEAPA